MRSSRTEQSDNRQDSVSENDVFNPLECYVWGKDEEDIRDHIRKISALALGEDETDRSVASHSELVDVIDRVKKNKAFIVLRKIFKYRSKCNWAEEIWVHDPQHPQAKKIDTKQYCVFHVHYHLSAPQLSNIPPSPLICASNARNLSHSKKHVYQADNRFFDTYIEESCKWTFKIFPLSKWTCSQCQKKNEPQYPHCGSCED
jgi:hypothetical protein